MFSFTTWKHSGLAAAFLATLSCNAFAEDAPAPPPGAYCNTGAAIELRRLEYQLRAGSRNQNRPPMPSITTLYEKCQPGDIIEISADEVTGIGRMCNFTQTVIRATTTVFCVYAGVRPVR